MKSIIVGTAGHIDHGKTALIKALTGIDADRLEEEKRRGITIDIGFAHLELPAPGGETLRFGFVDVPGHERFVRNMLAGIGGIDVVLFVIAADEGIMPQTREHFDICRLLAVKRGITVLTKSDLVDAETLEVVQMEVAEFVRGSFLDVNQSPIIAVSAINGSGIEELKSALVNVGSEVSAKSTHAVARLPIDRVFTMKGFGAVVTGTLIAGAVGAGDELEVFPEGRRVRVRGVQVHGQAADRAVAGERTALNLAGVAKDEMARGMTLAAPGLFQPTSQIDVSLALLASAKNLKDRARVHFHSYTFETIAEVKLYGTNKLNHGETGFACLRLSEPTLILSGDRFIVRQLSPVMTIGGGVVIDAMPLRSVPKKSREEFLKVFADGDPPVILRARVFRRGTRGLTIAQAVAETGWRKEDIERYLAELILKNEIVRRGDVLISTNAVNDLKSNAFNVITKHHDKNPLVAGMNKEALREALRIEPEIFALVLELLVHEKKLEAMEEVVRLPGRSVVMKDEEAEAKQIIESAFKKAGLQVPALKDVLAGLKVDKARAQKLVTLMLRDKVLIKISEELVFHRSALDDLRKRLLVEKLKSPKIDVARFKDLTRVSRKYAIPLLEYLDRERVTRREGDARVIL
jgi:selenocysteine-specific elongation factor